MHFFFYFADSLEGVPPYPLYKRLASALLVCMDSEAFSSAGGNLAMNHELENSSMQQKHSEWHKLIVEKGSEIVNVQSYCYVNCFICLLLFIYD